MARIKPKYVIVQHSAWTVARNPQFQNGLEQRMVETEAALARVEEVGGKVFDSWIDADAFCMDEMYPPNVKGLIPCAPGTFSLRKVDGSRIYIPQSKEEVYGADPV